MKTENIVTEVLPTEFADLCDVTRSAISKGRRAGRIHVNAHGMIPLDHPDNKLYKEGALFRKVGEMSIERRVFPGWSAICVPLPGRLVPVFYYPPVWEAGTVLSDVGGFFDDWKFRYGRFHRMGRDRSPGQEVQMRFPLRPGESPAMVH